MPNFTSAIDTAREAIRIAATLTPKQREALTTGGPAHVTVARNLRATGLIEHDGGPAARRTITTTTNLGRVVAMVLTDGADTTLTRAGREDAALFIATTSREILISESAAFAAGDTDPAIVAYRAALLDELHTRATADYAATLDPIAPKALLEVVERRVFGDAAVDALTGPADTPDGGQLWIIPAEGERLTDRHDVLGPYNGTHLADRIRDQYQAEGIACEVVRSVTRPVPREMRL